MNKSTGIFRYSPSCKSIPNVSKWWLVIDSCPELARLYRELSNYHYRAQFKLHRPAWDSHISIIRDEKPPIEELWLKYNGLEVEFEYESMVLNNGQYFWLPVRCEKALDIREEMGLDRNPFFNLHLSFGMIHGDIK